SGGVYQRSNRMTNGETINRQTAKSTYVGTTATLTNTHQNVGLDSAAVATRCHIHTAGAAETPHTTAWTTTSVAIVQAIRPAAAVRDGGMRESVDIIRWLISTTP